jgi:hypothetical protein
LNNSTCILVLSCDKYADIWQPFFQFFQRYWSDCPFPVYLGTNDKKFSFENVQQIFSHKKTTWSDELLSILLQIPEKYVIIILEDYFVNKPVNNIEILELINVMEEKDAAFMKLGIFPKKYNALWPHTPLPDYPGLASINKGSKYRLCLQTAIWNKNMLLELLDMKEDPWQFEIEASKRSNNMEHPFLTIIPDPKATYVHGPIKYLCTALSAGKWMRDAIRLCKKEQIEIDTTNRPVETIFEEFKRRVYIFMPIPIRKGVDFVKNKL